MNCVECGGVINLQGDVILRTSCSSYAVAYPCEKCGRLHWPPRGDEAHKTCDGQVIHK